MSDYQSAETELLDEYEPQWVRQGYKVIRHPRPAEIPRFLGGYRPDALVTGRKPNLVVEVLRKGQPNATQKLSHLQALLEGQDDWRLQVLYTGEVSVELSPVTADAMRETLQSVRHLADAEPRAGLLLSWAILEAVTRRLEPTKTARPQTPGRVVELLASAGYIVPSEAERLRAAVNGRNRLIHGDLGIQPTAEDVRALANVAEELIGVLKRREALDG